MIIQFEAAKEKRKELVKAISEVTGVQSVYQGAPGFIYKVGIYFVLANGDVEVDDFADVKLVEQLVHGLRGRGFNTIDDRWSAYEKPPQEDAIQACFTQPTTDGIVLEFPKEGMTEQAIHNVEKIIEGKGWLIKLALECDALPIEETENTLKFPWLPISAPPELINAVALLLAAIIKMAKKQQRVTFSENETSNAKYALRCFLLRLGFIGDEYKEARQLLMKGVPGNSAFRNGKLETAEEIEIL